MTFYYLFHNIQTFEKAKSPKLILTFFRALNCHSDGCKDRGEQFIETVNYVSYRLNLGLRRLKLTRRRVMANFSNQSSILQEICPLASSFRYSILEYLTFTIFTIFTKLLKTFLLLYSILLLYTLFYIKVYKKTVKTVKMFDFPGQNGSVL